MACGGTCPGAHRFCGLCGSPRTGRTAARTGPGELVDVLQGFVSQQLLDRLVEEGGRIPEQRRLVTALFADLSGFTPLTGRLDAESVAEILDPLLDALVRVVHRHEGYVGSFAGDALLAFFGAPVAHEDDAERALRAALQMLEEFPGLRAGLGPDAASLGLRCGVDTGVVFARLIAGDVRTDYAVLGDAVNMAQRMQSLAPVGACWVGRKTWELTRDRFDLAPLGEMTVKGKDRPLPAWELRGERTTDVHRWRASGARFVGRRRELGLLQEALARPGLALVRGEPGAGKSRLLDEARAGATARWVVGGTAPYDRATSFRPWAAVVRALQQEIGALPDDLDEQQRDGLRLVLGEPPQRPELTRTADGRRRTAAVGVLALLRAAAPVRIVLEDLHWADESTLALAEDVVRDAAGDDVVLVVTSRPGAPAADALVEVAAERATVVEVGPLGVADVATLLADVLDGSPPPGLAEEVTRRSGGNPLFAAELARALLDRDVVQRLDGGTLVVAHALADLGAAVPDSLEGLLAARVDALPTEAGRALMLAAVVGEPLRPDLLEAVAARAGGGGGVRGALDLLQAEGLLVGHGLELEFVHALIADTVYARTPRRRRRALHVAAADAAEDVALTGDEHAGYLARHLYLGGGGTRAVAALSRAADLAAARLALPEAVVHLTREAELRRELAHDRAVLPDRLVQLGEHLEVLGRYAEAEPVLREAEALGADWRAQRALAGALSRLGRYEEAIAVAEAALESAVQPDARARLLEEQGWSLAVTGRLEEALRCASSGHELQEEGQAAAPLRLLEAFCLFTMGRAADAVAAARDAAREHAAAGDAAGHARALRLLGSALLASGEPDEAATVLADGLDAAARAGAQEEVAACLNNLGMIYGTQGQFARALEVEQQAIAHADRMGHLFGRLNSRSNHAYTLFAAGRWTEARALAERIHEQALAAGLSHVAGQCAHTAACCLREEGEPSGAAVRAEEGARLLTTAQAFGDAQECWALAAEAWAEAGEPQRAEAARAAGRSLDAEVPAER